MPDALKQNLSPSFSGGIPKPPVHSIKGEMELPVPHPHTSNSGFLPTANKARQPEALSPLPKEEENGNAGIYKKVALVILDGFGTASASHGNAISQAHTPNFDYIVSHFPSFTLHASGPLVGLPWGEMGNSEVGHLNIGAGRIVGQDLPRITSSVQNGEFFKNKILLEAVNHASQNSSRLHLIGMVSDGGVHSLDEHLYALLALAEDKGVRRVYVHMFTDGRDTGEKVALDAVKKLRERIARIGVGEIATVAGRFYAMDRGGHFNQTDMTYRALVKGEGEMANSAEDCIWRNYQNGVYDEMIKPTVICDPTQGGRSQPVAKIEDNDAVIFFNFRPDRAVQLTRAFVDPGVLPEAFRHPPIKNLYFATMTEYAQALPVKIAFPSIDLKNNLAEVISKKNFSQFHISESEKYAHVTSFFDCGKNDPYPGEERKIVASPDNARNYVDHPEMSADELADILASKISGTGVNFFVANFANADMVGHTGSLKAGIKAVEALDRQIKKIMDSCLEAGACLLITADHGNIEQMLNSKTGEIDKDHTTNPVPLLAVAWEFKFPVPQEIGYGSLAGSVPEGAISDIAPTILDLLGLEKPAEMTGISLRNIIESRSKN